MGWGKQGTTRQGQAGSSARDTPTGHRQAPTGHHESTHTPATAQHTHTTRDTARVHTLRPHTAPSLVPKGPTRLDRARLPLPPPHGPTAPPTHARTESGRVQPASRPLPRPRPLPPRPERASSDALEPQTLTQLLRAPSCLPAPVASYTSRRHTRGYSAQAFTGRSAKASTHGKPAQRSAES